MRSLDAVNLPKMEISLVWVTGHMGSIRNEAADALAKTTETYYTDFSRNLAAGLSAITR
jgi:ribonuclease HI